MERTAKPGRRTWFVLWAAFTAAPVVYYVVSTFVAGTATAAPSLATLRLAFAALALVQLSGGAYLLTRAPRMRSDLPGLGGFFGNDALATPAAFQLGFVVATAFVEACAVLGFVLVFLGAPPAEYIPYGAASLAVMVAVALPAGLGYWNERERVDAGGAGPIA